MHLCIDRSIGWWRIWLHCNDDGTNWILDLLYITLNKLLCSFLLRIKKPAPCRNWLSDSSSSNLFFLSFSRSLLLSKWASATNPRVFISLLPRPSQHFRGHVVERRGGSIFVQQLSWANSYTGFKFCLTEFVSRSFVTSDMWLIKFLWLFKAICWFRKATCSSDKTSRLPIILSNAVVICDRDFFSNTTFSRHQRLFRYLMI